MARQRAICRAEDRKWQWNMRWMGRLSVKEYNMIDRMIHLGIEFFKLNDADLVLGGTPEAAIRRASEWCVTGVAEKFVLEVADRDVVYVRPTDLALKYFVETDEHMLAMDTSQKKARRRQCSGEQLPLE